MFTFYHPQRIIKDLLRASSFRHWRWREAQDTQLAPEGLPGQKTKSGKGVVGCKPALPSSSSRRAQLHFPGGPGQPSNLPRCDVFFWIDRDPEYLVNASGSCFLSTLPTSPTGHDMLFV